MLTVGYGVVFFIGLCFGFAVGEVDELEIGGLSWLIHAAIFNVFIL